MEKKPSQILQEALVLLGPKGENWTQNTCIQTVYGKKEPSFCSIGALNQATDNLYVRTRKVIEYEARDQALVYLQKARRVRHVANWNDRISTDFQEVKQIFEKAIKLAKKDEASVS